MKAHARGLSILLLLSFATLACATKRPVLYPNEAFNNAGWEVAQKDVDDCLAQARAYGAGGPSSAAKTAGSTAVGSASGAAVGAVVGAVHGRAGRGAAAGAAGGAVGGLLSGIFRSRDPDPIDARFVNVCLSRQGYQVLGWK
jgi:hypothetical protein